jgi:hypothetical protein
MQDAPGPLGVPEAPQAAIGDQSDVSIKPIASAIIFMMVGACTMPGDIAVTYDDPDYPPESTAVIVPSPDNVGKVVVTAAGGRRLRCGGWLTPTGCQRVRLLPGTTILRLDYLPAAGGQLAPARDMDLQVAAQSGHTYHIVATVVRDEASGQSGARRVVLHVVDKGVDQPLPSSKP